LGGEFCIDPPEGYEKEAIKKADPKTRLSIINEFITYCRDANLPQKELNWLSKVLNSDDCHICIVPNSDDWYFYFPDKQTLKRLERINMKVDIINKRRGMDLKALYMMQHGEPQTL
jgi:hypothetical protein